MLNFLINHKSPVWISDPWRFNSLWYNYSVQAEFINTIGLEAERDMGRIGSRFV